MQRPSAFVRMKPAIGSRKMVGRCQVYPCPTLALNPKVRRLVLDCSGHVTVMSHVPFSNNNNNNNNNQHGRCQVLHLPGSSSGSWKVPGSSSFNYLGTNTDPRKERPSCRSHGRAGQRRWPALRRLGSPAPAERFDEATARTRAVRLVYRFLLEVEHGCPQTRRTVPVLVHVGTSQFH